MKHSNVVKTVMLLALLSTLLVGANVFATVPRLETEAVTFPTGIIDASSVHSSYYPPQNAFDYESSWTLWITQSYMPQWISYEFADYKIITRYYLMPQYNATTTSLKDRSPGEWKFQGYNYRSDCWEDLDVRTGYTIASWPASGLSFNVQNPGIYKKYRLLVTATCGSPLLSLRTFRMYEAQDFLPVMSAYNQPYGLADASSYVVGSNEAWEAFDGEDVSTPWGEKSHWRSTSRAPQWLSYYPVYPAPDRNPTVGGYYVLPYHSWVGLTEPPKSWKFQGWNGYSWVTLDTVTGITTSVWDQREYEKGMFFYVDNPHSYQKYQIYITEGNNYCISIQQLKMYLVYEYQMTPDYD